jgi:outer membrane protein assembly factor BamA
VLALLLLFSGCTARHAGDAVGGTFLRPGIDFDVNVAPSERGLSHMFTGPNSRGLRNAMSHPQPRWQSFVIPGLVEPDWLDRYTLDRDAYRLEIWYANHGYFDARFLGWEITSNAPKTKRLRPVHVRGHIDEGVASRVRKLDIRGLESLLPPLRRLVAREVELHAATVGKHGRSHPGDIFTLAAYKAGLGAIRAKLLDQSYAHATVEGDVLVDADAHAVDITYRVNPGPSARFGAVTFTGLSKVPEDLIRDQVDVVEGEAFNAHALETTRARLYGLQAFGLVNVVPDLSDPTSSVIPVRIELSEAKTRELRAGPSFEAETGKIALYGEADISDSNVFGRLWRMEQKAKVGAGVLVPTIGDLKDVRPDDLKPAVDLEGNVMLPHLFGGDWGLTNTGLLEVGFEPGYTFFSPAFTPSLVYSGFKHLTIGVGYRIRYFQYHFDKGIDLKAIENSPLGLDVRESYFLSLLEQHVTYDGRNDPLSPSRGWYWSLALGEAGLGGDFQFLRGVGEIRAYRSVVRLFGWDPEVVLAGRLGGGLIVPYGTSDKAAVPYAERLYLGGSTTVRGWAANRLGPYFSDYTEDPDSGEGEYRARPERVDYPAGGDLQLYGNFELRKGLPWGLTMATFVDVGRVWDRPGNFGFDELQWSVGGGLRYATPIGPIRADIGYRLQDPAYFESQPQWAFHLGLGEAF